MYPFSLTTCLREGIAPFHFLLLYHSSNRRLQVKFMPYIVNLEYPKGRKKQEKSATEDDVGLQWI